MAQRPTIIDVARKAGVSKSTVSLVLQGSSLVREETRAQVRAAMAEIGYVYNRAAANLRSANVGLIGLAINDLRNPLFTEFATGLQMALSERGYATVIANTDEDPAIQDQVVGAMIEHGVSAMILSPAYGETTSMFDALARARIPALQVFRCVEDRRQLFPFSAPDYLKGGQIATQHLLDRGARRIAFVGGLEGRPVTHERMAGYLTALAEAKMEPLVLTGRTSRAFGREAARRLTQQHPDVDAVLCFNDLVALGIIAGCAQISRPVGHSLKLVGFDDIEEAAETWPPLSSVRCDVSEFSKTIATTVLAWLEDKQPPPPETRTPMTLVIRESSAGGQS
jgi:LacI family transcriptional regulator